VVNVSPTSTTFGNSAVSYTVNGSYGIAAGSLTVNGGGTVNLTTPNTYSGGTTISAGTLALSGSGTLGSSSAAVTASGGTLDLGATSQTMGTVTVSGGTVQNGTLTGASYALQSGTVSAVLAGSSIVATKTTSGTLTLSGANTYTGGTTISAGTLKLGAANVVPGNTYAGDVSVTGTLDLFGYSDAINGLNGAGTLDTTASSGTPTLTIGANGNSGSFSGVIQNTAGTLALIKSGAGTQTLSGNNTYSGGTTLNAGQITLGASSTGSGNSVTSGPLGTGTVTLSGGTLQLNAQTLGNNLSVSSSTTTIVDNSVNNGTLNGNVTGSGTITIQNSSSTGLSEYLGGDWSGFTGTLNYTTASSTLNLFALGSTLDLSHAAVNFSGSQSSSSFRTAGSYTTKFGSLSGAGFIQNYSTLEIGNLNTSTTYSGAISQSGAVTILGTGALTLSGANSYTSTTTVDNGSLIAGAAVSVSANGPFGNASSAIALGDATSISGNLSPSLLIGGAYTMARTVTVGANNTATTGIYTLGGNTANSSTFSGAIMLNQNLAVTQVASGTLNITGGITSGSSGTQTVTVNNPGAVNVGGTTGIGGGTGTIALTKIGSGTLTLSGANTYTGNTRISAGTLALSGSGSIASSANIIIAGATFDVLALPSTFALGSGQTLTNISGTGIIAGNVNLASGTLALSYTNDIPSLQMTNGTLNFNGNALTVNVSGTLLRGTYKLISTNSGGSVSGTLPSSVTVNGLGAVASSLSISNSELYLTVDHPPMAAPMTVTRTAGLAFRVALSDVATNWSDADGDTVTLTGINLTTTNGVNLMTNSSWILYTNSPNVNDQISYAIADGFGGTNIGYINIAINSSVTGTNSIVSITTGSTNVVKAYGVPGFNYILERATNLAPAVWIGVSTNTTATNGVINAVDAFNDLGNTPPASAYYRLKWHP
jgi:autotransporter-associated beta strand protein